MPIGTETRVSACAYVEDMDQNSHPFDSLGNEKVDEHLQMPWDQLLAAVRRSPQVPAVDAARIAQQRSGAPVDVLSPLRVTSPPTWDGLHTVLATLRRKTLLPRHLPQTRSTSVMLTHVLTELALTFTGHRGARPDLGVAAAEAPADAAHVRFETECITWLIAGRLGIRAAATGLLKGYLKHGELIPEFSRDRVLHTVNTIERLFGGALAFGTVIRNEIPSLFDLDETLAV